MRIPDPKANTTTEAYLAYKAGYLEESELKPVLYEPYLHFDAWLAYWAGLTNTYPVKNADAIPEDLVINFSPIQDLHGYDSPWPAGGGKNKANFDVTFPIVKNGITISKNDDGSISINGTATANFTATLMSTVDIDSGAWTISGVPANSAGGSLSIWVRNQNGGNEYARAYNGLPGTLNLSTGSVYIYCTISVGATVDNVKCFIQLESGSTATAWAPYSNICPISGHTDADVIVSPTLNPLDGTTSTIPLGQTVYGGTLDVTTGLLTVDRAMVDLGTLNYGLSNHSTLGQYFWCDVYSRNIKRAGDYGTTVYPSICSAFKCVSRNTREFVNSTYCFDGSADRVTQIQFKDSAYSDATSFKTAMSGVQLVYELATPVTYQLEVGSYAEPEMLTDEEALVAYLSGVTDTYPEEIKDPYDVRIVGYLKYLVSARWGRPEYPVNNEEFYLSTMKPPVVPSGDTPSSDIEMDDTAEAPFVDLKMYGDTSQQTYSGKNLLLPSPKSSASSGLTASYDATTGVVTLSGTASNNWSNAFNDVAVNLPAGTYTFSATTEAGLGRNIIFFNGSTNILQKALSATATSVECVVPQAITSLRLWLSPTDRTNYTGKTFKAQLEIGSQATSFEPYVGGIPAPNPEYPQPVQVVTGRQLVNVHGKNLANLDIESNTSVGVQVTNNGDQTLTFNGKATYTCWPAIMDTRIPVKVGKTYVMSIPEPVNVSLNFRTSLRNEALMQIPAGSTVSNSWSPSEDDEGWAFFTINSGTSVDFTTSVQIEEGSTPTDYQPYQGGSNEINLGKNLFDGVMENGGFDTYGINGENSTRIRSKNYIPVQPNTTYTIKVQSWDTSKGPTCGVSVSYYNTNDYTTPRLSYLDWVNVGQSNGATFTTPSGCTYVRFLLAIGGAPGGGSGIVYSDVSDVQLELGSTATSYAPYFTPIELCKIGDYQDYIYCDRGGDWYVHKNVRHLSLPIAAMDNGERYPGWKKQEVVLTDLPAMNNGLKTETHYYCNVTGYDAYTGTNAAMYASNIGNGLSAGGLMMLLNTGHTESELKTKYPNLVVEVYYGIVNPIPDTKITDSTLIAQLDALMEGGSYEGKTYIKVTATDPNLPGLLYVEAGKYD